MSILPGSVFTGACIAMDKIANLNFFNYLVDENSIYWCKNDLLWLHLCFYGRLEDKEEIFLDED